MAKNMRIYYAIGAVVIGIVLLYVLLNVSEEFADNIIVSIYLYKDPQTGKISVISTDTSIISVNPTSIEKISLTFNTNTSINKCSIKSHNTTKCPTLKNDEACWQSVSTGIRLTKTTPEKLSKSTISEISLNSKTTRTFNKGESFIIDGLSLTNLNLTLNKKYDKNIGNICIDFIAS
jgi:hypothetical protein